MPSAHIGRSPVHGVPEAAGSRDISAGYSSPIWRRRLSTRSDTMRRSYPQNSAVPATRSRVVPTGVTPTCSARSMTGTRGRSSKAASSKVTE